MDSNVLPMITAMGSELLVLLGRVILKGAREEEMEEGGWADLILQSELWMCLSCLWLKAVKFNAFNRAASSFLSVLSAVA